jgi:hypothetical protein
MRNAAATITIYHIYRIRNNDEMVLIDVTMTERRALDKKRWLESNKPGIYSVVPVEIEEN